MSISLNNIESRVTVLENKATKQTDYLCDYTKGVNVPINTSWKAPFNATIIGTANALANQSKMYIDVNGIKLMEHGGSNVRDYAGEISFTLFVKKNDVILVKSPYSTSAHVSKAMAFPNNMYYMLLDRFSSLFKEVISYVNLLK